MYVRVHDPDTGHEYDLPEGHRLITEGKVTLVPGVPASHLQRPARFAVAAPTAEPVAPVRRKAARKPRAQKAPSPKTPATTPDQSAPSPEAPQDATEEESA